MGLPADTSELRFALESLYDHQDREWVIDTIPHVLAWIDPNDESSSAQLVRFQVRFVEVTNAPPKDVMLDLGWDLDRLEEQGGDVREKASRLRHGRTVDRERLAEVAAYGLALVAISVFLPGRRVIDMPKWRGPDFLLDTTGALRGVEVAGRSSGGFAALWAVRVEKTPKIIDRADIAEAHLSLWCANPRVSELYMIKP